MRRILALSALCCLLCFSLLGCSNGSSASNSSSSAANKIASSSSNSTSRNSDASPAETEKKTNSISNSNASSSSKTEKKIQDISLGETVSTKEYEFTLNNVELSYDVIPDNPPSYYRHYPADSGYVYLYVNATIYNTGKKNLSCDKIYSVKAYYADGYTYNGFPIVEDTDGNFTYANIREVAQLEEKGVHNLTQCPEVVDSDTDSPLYIIITMSDKTEYKYVVR